MKLRYLVISMVTALVIWHGLSLYRAHAEEVSEKHVDPIPHVEAGKGGQALIPGFNSTLGQLTKAVVEVRIRYMYMFGWYDHDCQPEDTGYLDSLRSDVRTKVKLNVLEAHGGIVYNLPEETRDSTAMLDAWGGDLNNNPPLIHGKYIFADFELQNDTTPGIKPYHIIDEREYTDPTVLQHLSAVGNSLWAHITILSASYSYYAHVCKAIDELYIGPPDPDYLLDGVFWIEVKYFYEPVNPPTKMPSSVMNLLLLE